MMNIRMPVITIEGPEGSGKTTLVSMIIETLSGYGHKIISTREPGGDPIAEQIREILQHAEFPMDPGAEALLYAASRRQHLNLKVRQLVDEGYTIIFDRFIDSSGAYQGNARGLGINEIMILNNFAVQGFVPDKTFIIDIPVQLGLDRVKKQIEASGDRSKLTRIEKEPISFHEKVREGYHILAKMYPTRITIIDGERTLQEIHDDLIEQIRPLIIDREFSLIPTTDWEAGRVKCVNDKCPGVYIDRDPDVLLMTNPPKKTFVCSVCNDLRYVTYKESAKFSNGMKMSIDNNSIHMEWKYGQCKMEGCSGMYHIMRKVTDPMHGTPTCDTCGHQEEEVIIYE